MFFGDSFKADIFLAAKDTTQNPLIFVGEYDIDENGQYYMVGSYDSIPVVSGNGKYSIKPNSKVIKNGAV